MSPTWTIIDYLLKGSVRFGNYRLTLNHDDRHSICLSDAALMDSYTKHLKSIAMEMADTTIFYFQMSQCYGFIRSCLPQYKYSSPYIARGGFLEALSGVLPETFVTIIRKLDNEYPRAGHQLKSELRRIVWRVMEEEENNRPDELGVQNELDRQPYPVQDNKSQLKVDVPVFAVKQCEKSSKLVQKKWKSDDVYKMRNKTRGRCVIISNKHFINPANIREGTEIDANKMEALFTQLHFTIKSHCDKTAQEIVDLLKAEAKDDSHCRAECFVLVICSHGVEKGVLGVDEEVVEYETICPLFDAKHCKALANKPKLFFLQACLGHRTDEGAVCDVRKYMKVGGSKKAEKSRPEADSLSVKVPCKADFLYAWATHQGYVSWRNPAKGSWFLHAVFDVFQNNAFEKDLVKLLTMVNGQLAKEKFRECMQMSRYESSLRKDLYFFPGITE